jgi:hypothetical protein
VVGSCEWCVVAAKAALDVEVEPDEYEPDAGTLEEYGSEDRMDESAEFVVNLTVVKEVRHTVVYAGVGMVGDGGDGGFGGVGVSSAGVVWVDVGDVEVEVGPSVNNPPSSEVNLDQTEARSTWRGSTSCRFEGSRSRITVIAVSNSKQSLGTWQSVRPFGRVRRGKGEQRGKCETHLKRVTSGSKGNRVGSKAACRRMGLAFEDVGARAWRWARAPLSLKTRNGRLLRIRAAIPTHRALPEVR